MGFSKKFGNLLPLKFTSIYDSLPGKFNGTFMLIKRKQCHVLLTSGCDVTVYFPRHHTVLVNPNAIPGVENVFFILCLSAHINY